MADFSKYIINPGEIPPLVYLVFFFIVISFYSFIRKLVIAFIDGIRIGFYKQESLQLVKKWDFKDLTGDAESLTRLKENVNSFDPIRHFTITRKIYDAKYKRIGDNEVFVFLLRRKKVTQQQGKEYYSTHYNGNGYRQSRKITKERAKYIYRTGVFIPQFISNISPVIIRGRQDLDKEVELSMEEGNPFQPEKEVPFFNADFTVIASDPIVLNKVVTEELQKKIMSQKGSFPLLKDIKALRIQFCERGIMVTFADFLKISEINSLLKFTMDLHGFLSEVYDNEEAFVKAKL